MFKMGCSMAKRILTSDGRNSSSSPETDQDYLTKAQGSSSKKSKDKPPPSAPGGSGPARMGQEGGKSRASGDELNDFSKLQEDPRIPLNVRQIFKITKSWKAIARTMSKTGTAMFLNLFEQNQDLFYLFERFQHLKGKDLHESMELREHAATVMSTLDHSINSLSDYDNFVTYLHSIGKLHRKVPGFKRDHFWKIEQPFLKAVKQTLDERCNETIEEIYKIAIKLIIETIAEGYGDDQADQDGTAQRPAGGGNESSGPGGASDNGQQQQQNGETGNTGSRGGGSGNLAPNFNPLGQDNGASSCPGKSHGSMIDNGCLSGNVCGIAQRAMGASKCDIDVSEGMHPIISGCSGDGDSGGRDHSEGSRLVKRAPINSKTDELDGFELGDTGELGAGHLANDSASSHTRGGTIISKGSEGTLFVLTNLLALMVAKRSQQMQKAEPPLQTEVCTMRYPKAAATTTTTATTAAAAAATTTTATTINTTAQTDGCNMRAQVGPGVGRVETGGASGRSLGGPSGSLINYDQFGTTIVQDDDGMRRQDVKLNLGGEKCCPATKLNQHDHSAHNSSIRFQRLPCSRLHLKPNDKANAKEQSAYISISSSNNNNNDDDDDDGSSAIGSNLRDSIYGNAFTNRGNRLGLNDDAGANKPKGAQFPEQQQQTPMQETSRIGLNPEHTHGYPQNATNIPHSNPSSPLVTRLGFECTALDYCSGPTKQVNDHDHHHQYHQPTLTYLTNTADATANTARCAADCLDPNDRGETQLPVHTSHIPLIGMNKQERREVKLDNMADSKPDRRAGGFRWASAVWWQLKQSSSSLVNRKRRKSADRGSSLGSPTDSNNNTNNDRCLSSGRIGSREKRTPTDRKDGKKFQLTSDPGDLCELIKMLMLTVASRGACSDGLSTNHSKKSLQIDCLHQE